VGLAAGSGNACLERARLRGARFTSASLRSPEGGGATVHRAAGGYRRATDRPPNGGARETPAKAEDRLWRSSPQAVKSRARKRNRCKRARPDPSSAAGSCFVTHALDGGAAQCGTEPHPPRELGGAGSALPDVLVDRRWGDGVTGCCGVVCGRNTPSAARAGVPRRVVSETVIRAGRQTLIRSCRCRLVRGRRQSRLVRGVAGAPGKSPRPASPAGPRPPAGSGTCRRCGLALPPGKQGARVAWRWAWKPSRWPTQRGTAQAKAEASCTSLRRHRQTVASVRDRRTDRSGWDGRGL
jgi:hypothetical protein